MTTLSEIQKWVRPLVEWQPQLVQHNRSVIFKSVHHTVRGVMFRSGLSRQFPQVSWFLHPIFTAPRSWNAIFEADIPVGNSDSTGFREHFEPRTKDSVVRYLLPHESILAFHDFALDFDGFLFRNLRVYVPERATVLAALGRFEEAEALLAPEVARLETAAQAYLDRGRALLAKRSNSAIARGDIASGEDRLSLAGQLKQLLICLQNGDPTATAALLRQWEEENVRYQRLEEYWQQTPFPFEEVA